MISRSRSRAIASRRRRRRRNGRRPAPRTRRSSIRSSAPIPATGRKALFVNYGFTTRINELSKPESDAVLAFLFEHVTRPEFQIRHRWRENDLALWDNRVTQHYATVDYLPHRRIMHRATIIGERPVLSVHGGGIRWTPRYVVAHRRGRLHRRTLAMQLSRDLLGGVAHSPSRCAKGGREGRGLRHERARPSS